VAGLGGRAQAERSAKAAIKAHRQPSRTHVLCGGAGVARSMDKALGGLLPALARPNWGSGANVALARKLAQLFYRLLRYGMEYVEKGLKAYEVKVMGTESAAAAQTGQKPRFYPHARHPK